VQIKVVALETHRLAHTEGPVLSLLFGGEVSAHVLDGDERTAVPADFNTIGFIKRLTPFTALRTSGDLCRTPATNVTPNPAMTTRIPPITATGRDI